MPNEIITSSGLAAALGAKLLLDVCGPTAKYVGGELASYTKIGAHNLKRVFENAAKQIKDQNKIEGQVPPRVLKEILSEGYFCEDELQAMYLGGVLASSKGPISRDDRAIAYCSLVSSLSTYQLRTHCILYSALLRTKYLKIGNPPYPLKENIFGWIQKHGLTVLIREIDYQSAMAFCQSRNPNNPKDNEIPFRYFYPTILGVELFLWGQGFGDHGVEAYRPQLLQKINLPVTTEPYEVYPNRVNFL